MFFVAVSMNKVQKSQFSVLFQQKVSESRMFFQKILFSLTSEGQFAMWFTTKVFIVIS